MDHPQWPQNTDHPLTLIIDLHQLVIAKRAGKKKNLHLDGKVMGNLAMDLVLTMGRRKKV